MNRDGRDRLDGSIARTLEAGLSRLRGSRVQVREIERRFSRSSSTFRTERLRVFLKGAAKPLRIFFKDLNPQHQVSDARAKQPLHRIPPRRELEMYRSILSRERFGTSDLYGFRWEPGRGRFWLFLEDAGRTALNDVRDVAAWVDAARWAARFHAATRELPANQTRFLPRWTRAHYARCADHVSRLVGTVEGADRDVLRGGLEALRARLDWFGALPRCVIHGQFFGKNIMLRPQRARPRIAVIDWETAALGPPAWDLASITGGGWTEAEQRAMQHAYVDQYQALTGQHLDWDEFSEELHAVALHQTLEWLVWWGPHRSVPRRLKRFRRFMRELEALLDGRPAPPHRAAAAEKVG